MCVLSISHPHARGVQNAVLNSFELYWNLPLNSVLLFLCSERKYVRTFVTCFFLFLVRFVVGFNWEPS